MLSTVLELERNAVKVGTFITLLIPTWVLVISIGYDLGARIVERVRRLLDR